MASPLQSPSAKRKRDASAEVTWNGVISRPVSGYTKEMLDDELFTPVHTQLYLQRRIIGNAEGQAMFIDNFEMRRLIEQTKKELSELKMSHEDLRSSTAVLKKSHEDLRSSTAVLKKSHEDLRSSTAVLKKSHDDLQATTCQLRSQALNEWCDHELSTADRDLRNASVHGGDIVQDIKTINQMDKVNPVISLRWRKAFKENYGVDHHKCETLIASIKADRRMVWTFNTLANVRVLYKWSKEDCVTRETIDTNCLSIIGAWFSRPDDPFDSPEVVNWYDTAMNLFYS